MAKCLVLGANGFIGSHLVDALHHAGHSVRAFDRFNGDTVFDTNNAIEIVSGDFLNRSDLTDALKGIDYVFHFISTTTPATADNDPLIDVETNIRMSIELFQECITARVRRVIFASTGGAIYGENARVPCREVDLTRPVSPYAIGKLTIEHYLRYFRVKFGLDSVVLRISNPYGERQPLHRKQGVIPIFLENINADQPLTVLGDGEMIRDYVYVKDLAKSVAAMFHKPTKYNEYNIGSGVGVSVNQLVAAVQEVSHKQAQILSKPIPATFVDAVILDTTRYKSEFGDLATTGLRDGLALTYDYVQKEAAKHGS